MYEFELAHNTAEAAKNLFCAKKDEVDHSKQRAKEISLAKISTISQDQVVL